MKPSPLINKKVQLSDDTFGFHKDDVQAAVLFYKQYRNDITLLMKEQKKVWDRWIVYYNSLQNVSKSNVNSKFNQWLFDYCFLDVIKVEYEFI